MWQTQAQGLWRHGLADDVSDPKGVANTMLSAVMDHPEIPNVVTDAATWLSDMFGEKTAIARRQAADSIIARCVMLASCVMCGG